MNADGGGTPTGSFAVRIALKPQLTRVNSKGEIVPVRPAQQSGGAQASGGGGTNPNATSGTANGGSGSYPPSGSLPPSGSGGSGY